MAKKVSELPLTQETRIELMSANSNGIKALLIEIQDEFEFDTASAYFSPKALDELAYLGWWQKLKVVNWLKQECN